MIEFFTLPQEWLNEEKGSISITQSDEQNRELKEDAYWSRVQDGEKMGIRIADINGGAIYTIEYKPI